MGKSFNRNETVTSPAGQPERRGNPIALPRDQVDDWNDPYREDYLFSDGDVCRQCNAVFENDHWVMDPNKGAALLAAGNPQTVLCPACRKISSHDPQGIVTLRGDYWPQHQQDIINLIRNEEKRGMEHNPLERVMAIREEGEALIVETTNEKLAQRIGRKLHQAHKGTVDYQWPQDNRLLRVEWERKAA